MSAHEQSCSHESTSYDFRVASAVVTCNSN